MGHIRSRTMRKFSPQGHEETGAATVMERLPRFNRSVTLAALVLCGKKQNT